MQKIIPHLWFNKEAKEAAEFYTSIFPDGKITHVSQIHDTPSGTVEIVNFELAGYRFGSMSAGPLFTFNPSISFMLNFDPSRDEKAEEHLNELWSKLSEGGSALMPLQEYPFSKLYGWVQDKYGLSWQLILSDPKGESRPFIVPSMLFVGNVAGKAEEAMEKYLSIFKDTKRGTVARYPEGMEPEKAGTVMFEDFMIENQWFAAMDSALEDHKFAFNEAISFMVNCKDQAEIDYYWEMLSAVPEAEQCGWLKDAFGISWQVISEGFDDLMLRGTEAQKAAVTQAFLEMKKINLAELDDVFKKAA